MGVFLYKDKDLKYRFSLILFIVILTMITACSTVSNPEIEKDTDNFLGDFDGFIYLYPNSDSPNLFSYNLETNRIDQLTTSNQEIFDYTVSNDGEFVFYTVLDATGGSEVIKLSLKTHLTQRLLDCGEDFCFNPVFSDKNQLLLLHKEESPVFTGMESENTELWVYELKTAEFRPFSDKESFYGLFPKWNKDQSYVAVQQLNPKRISIFDNEGKLLTQFETNFLLGLYDWSPGGPVLYFVNEEINDDQPITSLWTYDVLNSEFHQVVIDDLTGGEIITNLSFSPDGNFWAAGIRENAFLPSQVLWVMETESDSLVTVIGDHSKIYSNLQWNSLGDKILFQNFSLDREQAGTSVIVWDLTSDAQLHVISDAWFPRWVP